MHQDLLLFLLFFLFAPTTYSKTPNFGLNLTAVVPVTLGQKKRELCTTALLSRSQLTHKHTV